jgi:hypothetical protein
MAEPKLSFFIWFIADLLRGDDWADALIEGNSEMASSFRTIKTSQSHF